MVNKCIICKVKEVKGQNGPYHRIPKDPVARTAWLKALNLTEVKEWDRVCGSHFHASDYWSGQGKTTQPMKKLKAKAVPFLRVYAEEKWEDSGECYNDEMSAAGTVNSVEQADDHVTAAGSSSISNITTSDEEMEDEKQYEFIPREVEAETKLLERKQDLQAEKIKSLETLLSHLRKKMRKQEDRIKEVERRLDETEYLRDMLKLV